MQISKATIIGTGNLATHLSKALEQGGINVQQIVGRNATKAKTIASRLYDTEVVTGTDLRKSESRLFFLCISDSAIRELASQLSLPEESLLVHCSGATSMQSIARRDAEYGVFYPLQTFSSQRKMSFQGVPVCLEASTDHSEELLEIVAKKIGATPCFMSSEQRLTLHLSAVFACNFTNHFLVIAKRLLEGKDLPFELLEMLIKETVAKGLEVGPELAQTGPAIRKDHVTMGLHESLLQEHPEWAELYHAISREIMKK